MLRKIAIFLFLILLFAGCASTGKRLTDKTRDKTEEAREEIEDRALEKGKDAIIERIFPW